MSGVLMSYWWHYRNLAECRLLKRFPLAVAGSGCLMLAPAFIFPVERTWWMPVFGLTLFYAGSCVILAGCLALPAPKWRVTHWLASVGACSYSIYLWHLPVRVWGADRLLGAVGGEWSWFLYAACFLVGSLIVGILTARLIEYPVLRIREQFFPPRRAPVGSGVEELPACKAPVGAV
jgi:peptidoglycan/LPS O-acetylase OafA/YrhL